MRKLLRIVLLCGLVVGLAGCKVELYAGLAERDANDILALLAAHNIGTDKVPGKDGVTVSVDESDVATAIDILNRNGFPRDTFTDLGQVFQKEGLISSPFEERIRFSFGLSQTLSETLTRIDGVVSARVHISLPEQQPYSKTRLSPSASVFVKYRPDSGVEEDISKIKLLVQNSVEGLEYDKISVALFQARETSPTPREGPPLQTILGVKVAQDSIGQLVGLTVAFSVLLLLLLGSAGYYILRLRRGEATAQGGGQAGG